MRSVITAAALAASVLSLALPAAAAPVAGAQYTGTITTSINTKSAYVGQPVTLKHVTSQSGATAGATMYGTVTKVVHAGQGRTAELQMVFNRMTMPDGSTYAVSGVVTGMQTNTKNNTLKEAGGAVAGMIVGNILGKTILHTGGGGLVGAAGGFLIAKNNREDMTVPAGSTVKVTLRSVRRQAIH